MRKPAPIGQRGQHERLDHIINRSCVGTGAFDRAVRRKVLAMPICLVKAAHGTSPPCGVSASSVTDKCTRPPAVGKLKHLHPAVDCLQRLQAASCDMPTSYSHSCSLFQLRILGVL
jgi:hypothetical protein